MQKALKSIENKRGTRVNVMKVVMDDITIETEEESDDGLWEVKPRQNSPSVVSDAAQMSTYFLICLQYVVHYTIFPIIRWGSLMLH